MGGIEGRTREISSCQTFPGNPRVFEDLVGATGFEPRIIEALREMPPDATVDDAIERLVFLAKIEAVLNELDAGKGIPHDQAKRRLGL